MDRFDLEERISEMHNIEREIDLLMYKISDSKESATEDEILNMLIGMKEFNAARFERLFNCFEQLVEQNVITTKSTD